ncbi:MAG TPA: hypothetical protein VN829_06935 [Dongiaceae bacterium]|nr:hypothetical protein [Dongiaceae bacterium]
MARLRAATNVTDAIPPLRPPRGELPPGFWEEHGALTVAGALLALVLLGVAGWLLTRRKPVAGPAPDTLARRALEPLRRQPEGGAVLSRVSQTLRLYLTAAFGLPPEELTSTEFCRLLRENPGVGPELSAGIGEFLRRCEERKFAPLDPQPALGAVQRAFEFIEAAERRLAQLRQAAPGGPFPGGKAGPVQEGGRPGAGTASSPLLAPAGRKEVPIPNRDPRPFLGSAPAGKEGHDRQS